MADRIVDELINQELNRQLRGVELIASENFTSKAVMDAVNNIGKDITIILIAHRLNTVKNCDIIFKLDKGQLVDQGTFDKIITGNKN